MRGKPKVKTIDDYLARLSDDKRAALQRRRKTIRAAAPRAEEYISYQLPAFRLDGRPLVAFGATAKHLALYPMSGNTVEAHKKELEDYDTSKGTLVQKLVKARGERRPTRACSGRRRTAPLMPAALGPCLREASSDLREARSLRPSMASSVTNSQ
jgi:uncharacterized protein YdhG (YjbR/CyaY superfamily)